MMVYRKKRKYTKFSNCSGAGSAAPRSTKFTTSIDLANHLDVLLADHEVRESRSGTPSMSGFDAEEKDCLDLAVDKMNNILQVRNAEVLSYWLPIYHNGACVVIPRL
jgi:hypothetical protein